MKTERNTDFYSIIFKSREIKFETFLFRNRMQQKLCIMYTMISNKEHVILCSCVTSNLRGFLKCEKRTKLFSRWYLLQLSNRINFFEDIYNKCETSLDYDHDRE